MLSPTGFQLEKCLIRRADCELHVARSAKDGCPVLIKTFTAGTHASQSDRARREVELLGALAGSGVPRVLECIEEPSGPVLVLEHSPGCSLRDAVADAPLDPAQLVELGYSLAETLACIHARRLLHLGLDPARIWLDEGARPARILDVGSIRPLGARRDDPARGGAPLPQLDGLRFISPEQTGRMGRGVDSRSDLYSLGACLYFAATGRAPFEAEDALALVHAHLARQPLAAVEVRPSLPATLSRMISRLLQKSPEARYQLAAALQTDFGECRAQLARTGAIADDLVLATADAPYRPLFSRVLYGREREEAVLREAFEAARTGVAGAILVSGVAGAGKTSLVDGLRQRVTRAGGYLAQGKFDLYRVDRPYSGVAAALGTLVHHLLTESDERLAAWDAKLRPALGGVASALVGVVPEIELVLPGLPAAHEVGPAQVLARLSLAVQRFIGAMASPEHPLVLFIDDLQWADAASREVLESVLTRPDAGAFLFVGAYRSDEVTEPHPIRAWIEAVAAGPLRVQQLVLAPLDTAASAAMLADALGRSDQDTRPLAERIARKTANNPLLIQQFVSHLSELGVIEFSPGVGWTWDDAQIAATGVVDDAVGLLAERIGRLPEDVAHVLELAACVGDTFGAGRLASLTDRSADQVDRALFTLSDEGLIAPSAEGFRFVHDRIREAARQRIAGSRSGELHYAIARQLLAETPPERLVEHVFEIADHLSPVLERAVREDREAVLRVHALAGERAVRAGAAHTAMRHLEVAIGVLEDGKGDVSIDLAVELRLHAADAVCQLGDYSRAEALLDPLRGLALPPLARARVGAKRIQVVTMGQTEKSSRPLPVVLGILREHGVRWPEAPSLRYTRLVVRYTDWLLRGPLDDRAFEPVRSEPSRWLPRIILLGAAAPVLQARASRSTCLSAALSLRCFRRYGYVGSPAVSLAAYAAYRRTVVGHTRGMERYASAALAWADRCRDATLAARCRFVVHAFAKPWFGSRQDAIDQLEKACQTLRELGDLEYALYAASQRANYVALCDWTLDRIETELRSVGARCGRTELEAYPLFAATCGYLSRAFPDAVEVEARCREVEQLFEAVPATRMACWPFWLFALCLLGRYDEAHRGAERAAPWAFEAAATSAQLADYVLVRGIAAAEAARTPRLPRRRNLRVVHGSARTLALWARGSSHFVHMAQALAAERASLAGRTGAAIRLYRGAVDLASRIGYVHHAAWFRERAARTLAQAGRDFEAVGELRRAALLFERWGATAKAEALATEVGRS